MHNRSNSEVATLVAEYVTFLRSRYDSREWMNVRSALARLVASTRTLEVRSIRLALDELELERELSANYRRSVWSRWRRFFAWVVEREDASAELLVRVAGWRPRFPTTSADEATPATALVDFATVARVLPLLPPLARDSVRVLAFTAARPSELLALRSVDIDTSRSFWIARPARHKTSHLGQDRCIIIPPPVIPVFDRRLKPFAPHDWLFPAARDACTHASRETVAQQLRRTLDRHKLPRWCLYDLRRLAARFARRHAGLNAAQALLGHARASTTEIYAPVDFDDAIEASRILAEGVDL